MAQNHRKLRNRSPSRQAKKSTDHLLSEDASDHSEKTKSGSSKNALLSYNEVPEWMREIHILNHYLPVTNSTITCLKNIFKMHMQTVNIWTHLIPSLLFIYEIWQLNLIPDYYFTEPNLEKMLLLISKISGMFGFTVSWVYHSHANHENLWATCLTADISGIAVMITGCAVSWLYYFFFCFKTLRRIYMSVCSTLGLIFVICNTLKIFQNRRTLNSCVLTALGLSNVVPLCHLLFINDGFYDNWVNWHWKELFGVLGCLLTGTVIYIFRFPESLSPGSFDLAFNSHNLFHICVVMAAYCHMVGLEGLQGDRFERGNVC